MNVRPFKKDLFDSSSHVPTTAQQELTCGTLGRLCDKMTGMNQLRSDEFRQGVRGSIVLPCG